MEKGIDFVGKWDLILDSLCRLILCLVEFDLGYLFDNLLVWVSKV